MGLVGCEGTNVDIIDVGNGRNSWVAVGETNGGIIMDISG